MENPARLSKNRLWIYIYIYSIRNHTKPHEYESRDIHNIPQNHVASYTSWFIPLNKSCGLAKDPIPWSLEFKLPDTVCITLCSSRCASARRLALCASCNTERTNGQKWNSESKHDRHYIKYGVCNYHMFRQTMTNTLG